MNLYFEGKDKKAYFIPLSWVVRMMPSTDTKETDILYGNTSLGTGDPKPLEGGTVTVKKPINEIVTEINTCSRKKMIVVVLSSTFSAESGFGVNVG